MSELKDQKKYMKFSEIITYGIGLFGVALLTGWMPDYTQMSFQQFSLQQASLELCASLLSVILLTVQEQNSVRLSHGLALVLFRLQLLYQ